LAVSLRFQEPEPSDLAGLTIFLSASIPDPQRWRGEADTLAITDAVVALARAFLTAGARLVTAAHPTIAPLLLYVAAEFPEERPRQIVTYQSEVFEDVLPVATQRFRDEGIGEFNWTPAAPGEEPRPGECNQSLAIMRRQMLVESEPCAAAFVGGMEGIPQEFSIFTELYQNAPIYAVGRPGGEARALVQRSPVRLRDELMGSAIYAALWRAVVEDLAARHRPNDPER
jgi:hypothetical protein